MTHEWLEDCGVVHSGNLNHQFCLKNLKGQWTQEASRAGPSICPSSGGVISAKWLWRCYNCSPPPPKKRFCYWASGARRPDFKERKPSPPQGRSRWGHPWVLAFSENPAPGEQKVGRSGCPRRRRFCPLHGRLWHLRFKKKKSRSRAEF